LAINFFSKNAPRFAYGNVEYNIFPGEKEKGEGTQRQKAESVPMVLGISCTSCAINW